MKLFERESFLSELDNVYQKVETEVGQVVFVLGEAGIGKTSVIRSFISNKEKQACVLTGACDSLLTPRPLGPIYDIAPFLSDDFRNTLKKEEDRSELFSLLLEEIIGIKESKIFVIEDIHWADEATLDFIKFFTRRIEQVNCLMLITYRDDEISPNHPIRSIYGEIPSHLSRKLKLNRLSIESVRALAKGTKYSPEEVFKLTEGNPFYVNEVLAYYSLGIPDNIKDSVLSVFYKQQGEVRSLWELISILPGKISINILQLIWPDFHLIIDNCINSGVLRFEGDFILFKHELYRKTIEDSLNPIKRIQLHERVLNTLINHQDKVDLAMLVHHAKNSNNNELVEKFAPLAAKKAALYGAHIQAVELYKMATEHSTKKGEELAQLYEDYAYECYLTNQTKKAIEIQNSALRIWEELGDKIRIGCSMRILSRLHWFQGMKNEAEDFGWRAIKELENGFPLKERAKAYSNYAQLKMLNGERDQTIEYGEKAVELAKKIKDDEILCHALNNIGSVLYQRDGVSSRYLYDSLDIALKNGFHEHVARAYTNISSICITHKNYQVGIAYLEKGLKYCQERDLDSWNYYMLSWKARYLFETGDFSDAEDICDSLLENSLQPSIVRVSVLVIKGRILIRRGNNEGFIFIQKAKDIAIETKELQRIVPVTLAYIEYGWITRNLEIASELVQISMEAFKNNFIGHYYIDLEFWMKLSGLNVKRPGSIKNHHLFDVLGDWQTSSKKWEQLNCPFEQAITLFFGDEGTVKEAFDILDKLGAEGTLEFLKSELRAKGVKAIPRGRRESTKSNPAFLTQRQIDVLQELRKGCTNAEIAEKLFISAKTVDHHVTAILSKLNVHTREDAVIEARKLGVLITE